MPFIYDYARPAVTTDIVVFSIIEGKLAVVLIERGETPFKGNWALPGGFVAMEEDLEEGARRELSEEAGVSTEQLKGLPFIQVGTYGKPGRDPRGRVITIAFMTLVPADRVHLVASTDASSATWYSVETLPSLAFDHGQIVSDARRKLSDLLSTELSEHADAVFSFLPEEFSLVQAQKTFEIIKGEALDRGNFRKWICQHWNLIDLDRKTNKGGVRLASLYSFSGRKRKQ